MITPMTYRGYCAKVEYDDECGVLRGEVLDINDLIVFHGDCVSDLKAAFRDAVDDYLEHCEEIGRTPEKPYSGKFSVRVAPDLHRRAARFAALHNMSINRLMAEAIENIIGGSEGNGAKPPKSARDLSIGNIPRRKTNPFN